MKQIKVIDSHTGGEPTRTVIAGGPALGDGSLAARAELFRTQFDDLRAAIINEPRGSDVLVGALLCEPADPTCAAGVIFFNNVSTLNMCGHGTIGVAVTLAHLGRIGAGEHRLETPVGQVTMRLHDDLRTVTIKNVPSYRFAKDVVVNVPEYGEVKGDIAWGGNWFFLMGKHGQKVVSSNIEQLSRFSKSVRKALEANKITGKDGALIDHLELFGPSAFADSKNFVLCPGGAYDRSPCGTGTSAKVACLAADDKLQPGQIWRQESIIGSIFEGAYEHKDDGTVVPIITGAAWLTAEATLLLDPDDPFARGIPS